MAKARVSWIPVHVGDGSLCLGVQSVKVAGKGPYGGGEVFVFEATDAGDPTKTPNRSAENPPPYPPLPCLYGVPNTWGRFVRTPITKRVRKAVQKPVTVYETVFEDSTEEIG